MHGIISKERYNDGKKYGLVWESNDTSVSQQTLFNLATYDIHEIVKQLRVRFLKADKNGKTRTNIRLDANSTSIKEQRHRKFGRCYTFLPEQYILSLGVYYVKAYL